mgnify:CR=1 FL=1
METTVGFDIISFLQKAIKAGASDVHLQVGERPTLRIDGRIVRVDVPALTNEDISDIHDKLLPDSIRSKADIIMDMDLAYEIPGVSRFRVNLNRQLGKGAVVIRTIPYNIKKVAELNLPESIEQFATLNNGMVLVTGPTGSGKSTTIAALIDYININYPKHIVTIEDPIEFMFTSKKSIVSQRQVGVDTESFPDGLKYALRQDPDVIFVGEIRDQETMAAALKAAETDHLVLSTLHTNDAVQTINRIVNMFEESYRPFIRRQLAETLRATIAQKLVYSEALKKRFPACEIMVVTSTIRDYIHKDDTDEIYQLLKDNNFDNMISMNASLADLVNKELITNEEAMANSNDEHELEKIFRGVYQGTKAYYD